MAQPSSAALVPLRGAAAGCPAAAALVAAGRRSLSLVDCVSFEVMRRLAISTAFAFDRDFARVGFQTIP